MTSRFSKNTDMINIFVPYGGVRAEAPFIVVDPSIGYSCCHYPGRYQGPSAGFPLANDYLFAYNYAVDGYHHLNV
jgi:hypothetical protein